MRLVGLWAAVVVVVVFAAHAAAQGSAASEKAALLAFKGDGNSGSSLLSGWTDATEPCAEGSWDSRTSGWVGVMCDKIAPEGRVTVLYLPGAGLVGDIGHLSLLTKTRLLSLSGNEGVHGDVTQLDSMSELRQLRLGETSVSGRLGRAAEGRGLIWIRDPWGVR